MELGHITDSSQSLRDLDEIFETTQKIKDIFRHLPGKECLKKSLKGKLVVSLFNQPSTRTRLKFELAGKYLGAEVVVINEITHTSAVKGENWYNTLRTFSGEGVDILTIRHPKNYLPGRLARICDRYGFPLKIINGGDGNHLHPTQSIGDVFTMKEHFGDRFGREPLKIAIGADMNARAIHSLVQTLANYPLELTLVSWQQPKFRIPRKYLKIAVRETECLPRGEKFDAIYWIRYQVEHGDEKTQREYDKIFRLTPSSLKASLKEDGLLLHPGPRTKEIDIKIDTDPRLKDGEQIRNGRFTAMALYLMMLNPRFFGEGVRK